MNPDQHRLTPAENTAIFETDIKPDLFAGTKPSDRPVAIIFGGQPGSGKSASVDAALCELEKCGGAVQIIGDDMRGYHPHYARLMEQDDKTAAFYTDRDTGQWIEKSIASAKEQRVNIIIEGTMRDGNKVAETMQSLRQAGYKIEARALAVNPCLSRQGILQRYENQKADRGTGRMTTAKAHQDGYDGMLVTLERIENEKLADRVGIYKRGGEEIYSNELLRDGEWARVPQARLVVEAERKRPMTLQERHDYAEGFDKLLNLIAKPSRKASSQEINVIEELRQRARRELPPKQRQKESSSVPTL
jgi:predicted ABC-type ATPase